METIAFESRVRRLMALALAASLAAAAVVVTRGDAPATAGTQEIRLLGAATLRQDASAGGTVAMLLSLDAGGLQHRAMCTQLAGGRKRLRILVRSDKVGGRAFTRNGSLALDTTPRELWSVEGPSTLGFHETYEILYRDGTTRMFDLTFAVNHGRDCVSRIVATTA